MRRPVRTRFVAALALALLAACGGGQEAEDTSSATTEQAAPESAATEPPEPSDTASEEPSSDASAVGRPEGRACYDLSFEAALSPTSDSPAVDCSQSHSARTYAIAQLDLTVAGHLLAVDSARAQAQPARECPSRLAEFLGGSEDDRRLSVLRAVWFSPTVEQSDAGARWYRCDVIALAAEESLAPLGGGLEGVLDRPEDGERYRLCGTAEPGTDGFERVACGAEHSWRAISVVPLAEGDEYPGRDQVSGAGDGICEDAARASADDPLNFRWGYEWPTREQWDAGQRYGVCWEPA